MPKDMSGRDAQQMSPPAGGDEIGKQLNESYAELRKSLDDLGQVHTKCDDERRSILTLYDKIKSEEKKISNYHRSKLKTAYGNSLKACGAEAQRLRDCLEHIHKIRRLKEEKRHLMRRQQQQQQQQSSSTGGVGGGGGVMRRGALMMWLQKSAATMKLWMGDVDEKAPPLCGAIAAEPNHICQAGDLVAARVKATDGDDNWILAEVKRFDPSTSKYDVEDIDEEQKERYVLTKKKIIPLPRMRAHPQLNPEAVFELNAVVWALYPQTTCFYKGVVERRPQGPNDDYYVAFDDTSFPTGFSPPLAVQQRYVVAH